jgi:hypothetical protein
VRFASFWQRPHFMAASLLKGGAKRVLWVDPYPTRLPRMSDFRRPTDVPKRGEQLLEGVEVVSPFALPIEPLRAGAALNRTLFGRDLLASVAAKLRGSTYAIGVGKPSPLAVDALQTLGRAPNCVGRFFDAMDEYAGFYKGVSSAAMRRWEQAVLRDCEWVQASATTLCSRISATRRGTTRLCLNGVDLEVIRRARESTQAPTARVDAPLTFGYVGTMGDWFDWGWTLNLAKIIQPRGGRIVLLGPLFSRPQRPLTANIEIRKPAAHYDALCEVAKFDVGIIPFRITPLTESVDPIKYYEYRTLGLPVLATPFGELRRKSDHALVLTADAGELDEGVAQVLALRARGPQYAPGKDWSWSERFAPLNAWLVSLERAVKHSAEGAYPACTLG